jgi:hypothetical protein
MKVAVCLCSTIVAAKSTIYPGEHNLVLVSQSTCHGVCSLVLTLVFFLFLFLPPYSATIGQTIFVRYGSDNVSKVTLPAWPGQGLDAIVIFRPLREICILVRTRMLFAFCMIWIFVLYIWIF